MLPADPDVARALCQSILTRITRVEQLISRLERAGFPLRQAPSYSSDWDEIRAILAQVPPDWEDTALPIVCSLLEYGASERPAPDSHQRKTNSIWFKIMRHLASPSSFFSLSGESFAFSGFTKYVTSSPLVKTSDRMIFISFSSVLKNLDQLLYQDSSKFNPTLASQWGLSLARQCGLMGSCIEKYQGAITTVYLERGLDCPLTDLDVTLDRVLKVLNAFPMYISLANEAIETLGDLCRLILAKSLSDRRTIAALSKHDSLLEDDAREQEEVVGLEAEIRRRLIVKYGKELGSSEAATVIAAARSQVSVRSGR